MKRRQKSRDSNLTGRFLSGELEETDVDTGERFGSRSRDSQAGKMLRTALLRAEEQSDIDVQSLPTGQVMQVYSLFSEVETLGKTYQCVVRKTLAKLCEWAFAFGCGSMTTIT